MRKMWFGFRIQGSGELVSRGVWRIVPQIFQTGTHKTIGMDILVNNVTDFVKNYGFLTFFY